MGYLLLGLLLLAAVGTGGGYWHGIDVGEQRYKDKLEAAQQKVQEQADKAKADALQHQTELVTAFDKGRAATEEKTKIVYVKAEQYATNDKALSSPQCVMSDASVQFANAARADLSTAAAAIAALGLSEPAPAPGREVQHAVPAVDQGRSSVPAVPAKPAGLQGADGVPGAGVPQHPKPSPIK